MSRTCDYHHHWQDVTVGSILGLALTYIVFSFYYPPLTSPNCGTPLMLLRPDAAAAKDATPRAAAAGGGGGNDLEASPVFNEAARPRIYNQ